MSDDQRNEGLHAKFRVERTDPEAQERHKDCWVFVMEPRHDPLARVALKAYVEAAEEAGYLNLATDLRRKLYDMGYSS